MKLTAIDLNNPPAAGHHILVSSIYPYIQPASRFADNLETSRLVDHDLIFMLPDGWYELRALMSVSYDRVKKEVTLMLPAADKGDLRHRHNGERYNNHPLWVNQAQMARSIVGKHPDLASEQWHLQAQMQECLHELLDAFYAGMSNIHVHRALLEGGSARPIENLAAEGVLCFYSVDENGNITPNQTYGTWEMSAQAWRALAAQMVADKDSAAPTLRHDMSAADFKRDFLTPAPAAVSVAAHSTNYRTGTAVTATVTRANATGGTITWQIKGVGRLGWQDAVTDAQPPVAITGETFTPTAAGTYRAVLRGAVDTINRPVAEIASPEFLITTA